MIWALSAVSLVRFCRWALFNLSDEELSSCIHPATKTVTAATTKRRVVVR
jgi:hypothetical protein